MCGRFALYSDPRKLMDRFNLVKVAEYHPSYNIPPGRPIAAITQHPDGRHFDLYRWGLVPMWAKEIGHYSTINARAETIDTKPAFRGPFRHHRCLIPVDGYYEWQRYDATHKQPWYLHAADSKPMAFAGLFDLWTSPEGDQLRSATIIVTTANDTTKEIHDHMPVILQPEDWDQWLSPDTPRKALLALLQPAPDGMLNVHPVSVLVNKPTHDEPSCIEPI